VLNGERELLYKRTCLSSGIDSKSQTAVEDWRCAAKRELSWRMTGSVGRGVVQWANVSDC